LIDNDNVIDDSRDFLNDRGRLRDSARWPSVSEPQLFGESPSGSGKPLRGAIKSGWD
jgi:hypothetical protein